MVLRRKILVIFILVSMIINVWFLLNIVHNKYTSDSNRFELKVETTCELLAQVNSSPLYDYDTEKIKTNLQSFLKDSEVVSINLREENGTVNIQFEDPSAKTRFLVKKTVDVVYGDEKIGIIEVVFSKFDLYRELNNTFRDLFLSFLLITFIVALALNFFVGRMIKPVSDLTEVASEIANGNLERRIEIKSKDEIGILARSFELMQQSIKQKINTLKVENERREQTLFRSRTQQAAILKITSREHLNASWDEILKLVSKTAGNTLNVERTSIWRLNNEKNIAICENLYEKFSNKHQKPETFDFASYPKYYNAVVSSSYIATSDARNDDRTKELADSYLIKHGIYSMLDVPIKIHGRLEGIVCFEQTGSQHVWTADECVFGERIGDQLANFLVEIERKQIISALRESEERFRLLIQNLKSVVIYQMLVKTDGSREYLYISPNTKEINSVSHEEVLKDPTLLLNQIDEEYIGKMLEASSKAIKNFETFEFEMKVNIPGKINQWRQLIETPRKIEDGQIILDGVQIDITGRKRVEEYRKNINEINEILLRTDTTEELRKNIVEAMFKMYNPDRAWIGQRLKAKNESYKITQIQTKNGYEVEVGRKVFMDNDMKETLSRLLDDKGALGFYSTRKPKFAKSIEDIFQIKSMLVGIIKPQIGQNWIIGVDQCRYERYWINEEKLLIKEITNKVTNSINTIRYSRELQKTEKYISNIIDSMPSMLIGVDIDGRITQWNREAERITGYSAAAANGKELNDVLEFAQEETAKIKKALKSKDRLVFSKRIRREKTRIIYENITIYPLISNGIDGAVIRIDDITERVNMEEMMIQSEKMMSIGGLAAGMAHEINNPLAGIVQNSQVLQNRMTKENPANLRFSEQNGIPFDIIKAYFHDRKIDKIIANIINSGSRAAEIVRNMLTFARLDGIKKEETQLTDIVENTIKLASSDYDLKKKYDFRRIKIIREYQENVPNISCSPGKIQQVLLNLLKNGAEAMAEKNYEKGQPTFIIRNYYENNWNVLEIADNGPGMDKDVQKRIFEPFYTTKDPGVGTGLGLSISYFIIAENHKGEMWVESYPHEGTKFFIRLPVSLS